MYSRTQKARLIAVESFCLAELGLLLPLFIQSPRRGLLGNPYAVG